MRRETIFLPSSFLSACSLHGGCLPTVARDLIVLFGTASAIQPRPSSNLLCVTTTSARAAAEPNQLALAPSFRGSRAGGRRGAVQGAQHDRMGRVASGNRLGGCHGKVLRTSKDFRRAVGSRQFGVPGGGASRLQETAPLGRTTQVCTDSRSNLCQERPGYEF